ncbi:hypothetical protein KAX08_03975 [candidate division WOR-3 bacterium]|nr:hypothetical protein [candidate division WOR-3 bacterium]
MTSEARLSSRGQWLSQLSGALVAHEVSLVPRIRIGVSWLRYSHSGCWVSMDHDPVEIPVVRKFTHVL